MKETPPIIEPEVIGYRATCLDCSYASEILDNYDRAVELSWDHAKMSEFAGESHRVQVTTLR